MILLYFRETFNKGERTSVKWVIAKKSYLVLNLFLFSSPSDFMQFLYLFHSNHNWVVERVHQYILLSALSTSCFTLLNFSVNNCTFASLILDFTHFFSQKIAFRRYILNYCNCSLQFTLKIFPSDIFAIFLSYLLEIDNSQKLYVFWSNFSVHQSKSGILLLVSLY